MWPFLTLSTSFSCRAFKAWPKKTLTCISWYRQRRPIFASFKMAPIHNRLANVVRKGTQRPASSYAVPVRSVMVTSRSVSVVVSSLWVCSTGRGWMASECFSAVLNMRDLQENMLFNLQKHMGNVPTVCLCELTDLIKKNRTIACGFIQSIWAISAGTATSVTSNFHAHLLKPTKYRFQQLRTMNSSGLISENVIHVF